MANKTKPKSHLTPEENAIIRWRNRNKKRKIDIRVENNLFAHPKNNGNNPKKKEHFEEILDPWLLFNLKK